MSTEKEAGILKDLHHVTTSWKGNMHFECLADNHIITLDKLEIHGGNDLGGRPKALILAAMGGCTGMEIVAILAKMRLKMEGLEISITGELNNEQPKIYKSVHLLYQVRSRLEDREKIERAIRLATDKYCGVVAMVRHFATVTFEISFI